MDSLELNKIFGAVLAVCTFTLGAHIFVGELYKTKPPARPGFQVATAAPAQAAAAAAEPARPIAEIMREADASRGQAAFRPCAACHTVDQGGRNGTGPNLWDTFGGRKAHIDGFNYSAAMRTAAAAGQQWNAEELYRFLEAPSRYMRGTTMSFAGISRSGTRADIVAYLRSLSANPKPLPQ
jgi:cytochrome c